MNSQQLTQRRTATVFLVGAIVLSLLYVTSLYSYLLFHSLAETFSMLVAGGVYMLAWNSRDYHDNGYLPFIGVGYLFVAIFDLLHMLAYEGMGVFDATGGDLAAQIWLAARYLQVLTLLIAPVFLKRRLKSPVVWLGYTLLGVFLVGAIFVWHIFPAAFIDGQGLTTFKKVSEYVISAGLIAATLMLIANRKAFDRQVLNLLIVSFVVTAVSELAFTLYTGIYDIANLIGHLLKIIAVFALYRAIVQTGLIRPYSLLFHNLKSLEERYRSLFDEAPVMYVTLRSDAGGPIVTGCNELFATTLGYAREEIVGQSLANFYTETSRGYLAGGWEHAINGEPRSRERQLLTRSGEIVHALIYISTQPVPGSKEADIRAAYTNITTRKRVEQSEREQRRLAEALTDITAALNSTLDLDVVLDRILTHVGEVVPHDAANIMLLEDDTAVIARHQGYGPDAEQVFKDFSIDLSDAPIMAEIVKTREPVVIADVREREDWFNNPHAGWIRSYAAAPICHEERVIGFINLDSRTPGAFSEQDAARLLTFATSATTALRNAQLYRQAEEARHLAERAVQLKLRFLAMVSHELRTPLTSIQGFTSTLLATDVEWEPATQREFLETIDNETDRLAELIDQLLDLSRIESGRLSIEPQVETLNDIIAESQSQLSMLADHHTLELDIPDNLPALHVDARRVEQVLTNLVSNAAKYAPKKTRITVSAQALKRHVKLSVADQGPGIPVEQREAVFEAFTRLPGAEENAKGSGLGLAICKGIVEAHGGHIWVEPAPGGGATFAFTLPIAEDAGAA